jgi:hypothetical protein
MKALASVCIVGAALAAAATAAAPPTVSLALSPTSVAYGTPLTASGQLSTKKANQQVAIQGTECGSTRQTKAATTRTNATGAYSVAITPALGTSYRATFKNAQSAAIAVSVRPVLVLTRVARGSFSAKATAGSSLTGKFVLFQRYKKLRKRWVQVKRLALGAAVPGPAKPTMITSVSFRAKLARGTRVRVLISKAQAAPCYLTAASKSIRA